MKILIFLIFLLISELFIKSNKALKKEDEKGCHCKPIKFRCGSIKNSCSVHSERYGTVETRCVQKVSCDCAPEEPKKFGNFYKDTCHLIDDNPEKCFNGDNRHELENGNTTNAKDLLGVNKQTNTPFHSGRNKEISIVEDCPKCTLQIEDNGIILKCTPISKTSKKCTQPLQKSRTLILHIKFLQINTDESSKKSVIKSLMERKYI